MSFTPGPWEATFGERDHFRIEQPNGGYIIAVTVGLTNARMEAANAHILAAAPDLYAALKAIIEMLQREAPGTPLNNHRFDALGIDAHAALAKADGK